MKRPVQIVCIVILSLFFLQHIIFAKASEYCWYTLGETCTIEMTEHEDTIKTTPAGIKALQGISLRFINKTSKNLSLYLEKNTKGAEGTRSSTLKPEEEFIVHQPSPGTYNVTDTSVNKSFHFTILNNSPAKYISYQKILTLPSFPTSFVYAPKGKIFYTEMHTGNIRVIQNKKLIDQPLIHLNTYTNQKDEVGLLGIAIHPNFNKNHFIYVFYTRQDNSGSYYNRVERLIEKNGTALHNKVIMDNIPASKIHNGGVMAFGPDGKLYISIGDVEKKELSANPATISGKLLRINDDGAIPRDNPIPESPIFSTGHRNIFGLAFNPTDGTFLATENGTTFDEINLLQKGRDYGWPTPSKQSVAPHVAYTPSIAPTHMIFYSGNRFKQLQNSFIFGSWVDGGLRLLKIRKGKTVDQPLLLGERGIIDVFQDHDGNIYFADQDSLYQITDVFLPNESTSENIYSSGTFFGRIRDIIEKLLQHSNKNNM